MDNSGKRRVEPADIQVGHSIRKRRIALRLSQTAIGNAIGVTFQQIQKYEKGSNRLSASKLHKLAEVLKVPPHFFFEGLEQGSAFEPFPDLSVELHSQSDTLALIEAFQRIRSRQLRRSIVALLAELSPPEVVDHVREQTGLADAT
jgi:integration host factor subunit beta